MKHLQHSLKQSERIKSMDTQSKGSKRIHTFVCSIVSSETFQFLLEVLTGFENHLLLLDILIVLSGRICAYSLGLLGYRRSIHTLKKGIVDPYSVWQGDILSMQNYKCVVRRNVTGKYPERRKRVCLSLVCNERRLLASKKVTSSDFAFQPSDRISVKTGTYGSRIHSLELAKQSLGEVTLACTSSKFERQVASLFSTQWNLSKVKNITRGDFVFFIHKGCYIKGIVSELKMVPPVLEIDAFSIDENRIIVRNRKKIDLNTTNVWQQDYDDLDCVFRERIIHSMSSIEDKHDLSRYSTILHNIISGNFDFKRFEDLFIHIEEASLNYEVFPRIKNVVNWMKHRNCLHLPNLYDSCKVTNINILPTVIIISSSTTRQPIDRLLQKNINVTTKTKSFLLPRSAKETYMKMMKEISLVTPCVTLCILSTTEKGCLTNQDKDILQVIVKQKTKSCLFLILRNENNVEQDVRLKIGQNISKVVDRNCTINTTYPDVFFVNESEVEKRIAFLLEVLLHRNKDVDAFSYQDDELQVFSCSSGVNINVYLSRFLTEDELKDIGKIAVRQWSGPPKPVNCQIKQGSKVRTPTIGDSFGTVGLFVRDNKGNIYFTTCEHVIKYGQEAFPEETGSTAIGRSVHARTDPSIIKEIDVSIVKVNTDSLSECRYGIRDPDDRLVEGTISVANDVEMKDLKLYKWGAKSGLTKGTYKGMLCIRQGEDFNNRIIFIEGNVDQGLFAEPGDSGSLICFEATCSPQFSTHSGAFIFVGHCLSGEEYVQNDCFAGFCYNVSDVFKCSIDRLGMLEPMLKPIATDKVTPKLSRGVPSFS